jgi:hypothetical protein
MRGSINLTTPRQHEDGSGVRRWPGCAVGGQQGPRRCGTWKRISWLLGAGDGVFWIACSEVLGGDFLLVIVPSRPRPHTLQHRATTRSARSVQRNICSRRYRCAQRRDTSRPSAQRPLRSGPRPCRSPLVEPLDPGRNSTPSLDISRLLPIRGSMSEPLPGPS